MSKLALVLVLCLSTAFAAETKLTATDFGELRARNLGPATMSGRITDIDCPADDPNTVYVSSAGGGVWKSTDGGIQFSPIFDAFTQSIGCLTIDPGNSKILWVGTGEINVRNSVSIGAGVYRSKDGGESWEHMGLPDSERIGEIVVHPTNGDVVFVAVLGPLWGDGEGRGLYKTEDGGKTWKLILQGDKSTGCIDVDMDPQEPDTLYAAMWQVRRKPYFFESGGPGGGLYKSTDGGETWTPCRNGLPEGDLGRIDFEVAPSRPNRLYAMVESKKTGLYRSDDAGNHWELVSTDGSIRQRPFYLSVIKVDPKDHNRIYNPSYNLSVSIDGGKKFGNLTAGDNVHSDIQAIWVNPRNPEHLVIGTDGGVYTSYDRGGSFNFVESLPVSQFYKVSVDDRIPYQVYGGLQDNGSWIGPSFSPGGIMPENWRNIGGGDGFQALADRRDPNYVYWLSQGGSLNRLDLETNEQKDIKPYPGKGMENNRFNWNTPLVHGNNESTLYVGSQYLYKTTDRGDTWVRISGDLSTDDPEKQRQEESGGLTPDVTAAENHCTIYTISESPRDEKVIWVGTDDGNVQVTRDMGENWRNVTVNIPDAPKAAWVSHVEASPHQAGTAYVTLDNHRFGDMKPYLYKTDDFGASWRALGTEGVNGYCHVVIQDPVNPSLLFLGTEWGLYLSLDDGGNWSHFTSAFPHKVGVRDMVIQERESDLVIATHGRGIFIIDDITPLRGLTSEVLASSLTILPSRPSRPRTTRYVQRYIGSGLYVAPNADDGLTISYYMKKRHIFGDMGIEIYDSEGNLVKQLPGGKRKGINRVSWNLRRKPPKVSQGSGFVRGALYGPRIKEGTYTVKIKKGQKVYEQQVQLLPDRLNKHSKADRDLQYQAAMKLYHMQEHLAFLADAASDMIKQCEDRLGKVKGKKLTKMVKAQVDQLIEVRNGIVAGSDDVFVTKTRLRDEVVDLYGSVAGYNGRPTANQLDQVDVLTGKVDAMAVRFNKATEVAELNRSLEKAQAEPIKALDKEAWLEQLEKGDASGGGTVSRDAYKFWQTLAEPLQQVMAY